MPSTNYCLRLQNTLLKTYKGSLEKIYLPSTRGARHRTLEEGPGQKQSSVPARQAPVGLPWKCDTGSVVLTTQRRLTHAPVYHSVATGCEVYSRQVTVKSPKADRHVSGASFQLMQDLDAIITELKS